MAFNQATLFFFAPQFRPHVEFNGTTSIPSGKRIGTVSASVADSTAPPIFTREVQRWFLSRGWREKDRYGAHQSLFWGQQSPTIIGPQVEAELELNLDKVEVQELRVRFLLTDKTPDRLFAWRDLIVELGQNFGFRVMDEDYELQPCLDFVPVLAQTWSFCAFNKQYGWRL